MNAYAGWQHFEQEYAQGTLSQSKVPGYDEHTHLSMPIPRPLAFIMACPYIDVQEIPEGERNCSICSDPYHEPSDRATNDRSVKVAQRLPYGHQLCDNCMDAWLYPFGRSNNNTCPFDRRVFFPKPPHYLNTEGIQGRLGLVRWLNRATGRQIDATERDLIARLKAMLVERRPGKAIQELEGDRNKVDTLTMRSRINNACEIDYVCHRELQHFGHRLNTVGAIAESMEGHMQISTLQARLQRINERFARY